jgi:hypothetical protein
MRRRVTVRMLGLLGAVGVLIGLLTAVPAVAATGVVEIQVLSGRADVIAGGDALVTIAVPADASPADLAIDVDGNDVAGQFADHAGRFGALLTGLVDGPNVLTAALPDGRGASITITSHPIGGPVFSGPQIQPWTCAAGATDAQCNRPVAYTWSYKSTGGGALKAYNPASPPTDVATTTTDQGNTVPFIVREERGAIARDEYRIAVLYDPTKAWDPLAPQPGYNAKLVLFHGASCDTGYAQASAPDVMNETALSRGFATASHALDNAGHNCNIVTQAESLAKTKERVAEQYGPIRYTIGSGCSGGSLTQQQVANAYPGIYQAITPQCSFTDAWSSAQQYIDYVMLRKYLEDPARTIITPAQWPLIYDHPNAANAVTFTTAIPNSGEPTRSCPGLQMSQVYDENTNPTGVRCTLQDYMVNVFGRDADGKARRAFDNSGIQYGLKGLLAGAITPAQFVDLNVEMGGGDLDFNPLPERIVADPFALDRVYASGAINTGNNLDQVAIIDLRGPDPGAFHDVYRTYSMRERLIREHGNADNQILWRGPVVLLGDATFVDQAILAADKWLAAVEADGRAVPLAQKVREDRPADVTHRCTNGNGTDVPAAVCDAVVQAYGSPRTGAGAPIADDTMKCQTKPLDPADYGPVGALFTEADLSALRAVYPDGVCDYTKPGVSAQGAIPWLTYAGAAEGRYGGEPLGPAPVSEAFGSTDPVVPEAALAVLLPFAALVLASAFILRRRPTR